MAAPIDHANQAPVGVAPPAAYPTAPYPDQPVVSNQPGYVAAPQAVPGGAPPDDIGDWKNMFNAAMADPSASLKSKSATDANAWHSGFCGFCWPIDKSLLTCCCPCITFGKTYHRTRKNGNMEGYETINTSCLLFCATSCFGLYWIPEAMLRSEIRKKYNLKGSCFGDLARSFCCVWCELMQSNKEVEYRDQQGGAATAPPQQYSNGQQQMNYEQKV